MKRERCNSCGEYKHEDDLMQHGYLVICIECYIRIQEADLRDEEV